ncbi:MAG TPA: T9SS type A sorting domain-containing protein [Bacteroidetes bacterium]|nr:T9SS type A sorting domain-containing protein [Bacteroidota bacterium]
MKYILIIASVLLINISVLKAQNPADFAARTQLDSKFAPFYHGVASGDPLSDRVIIWTRITTSQAGAVIVNWEMATDTAMSNVVASGSLGTSDTLDYTVKVDVTGLQPGTWYYYRFEHNGRYSLTGRTFTAPTGNGIDSLRFGVVSCSKYSAGYFNAYGQLAQRNDLHAIVHLGDYIYEHGDGTGDREHEPSHEILVLEDYRMRHSQYKLDKDLRCIHQMYPFITIWDDHESANDSWKGGAENHQSSEGNWADRKGYAIRSYLEWMPIRQPDLTNPERIYRTLSYGGLLDFFMLDTRLIGRDEQVSASNINDPSRNLIGPDQLSWLSAEMQASTARWKVIAQQVMMAPLKVFGIPVNTDQWDGYPNERQRLYDSILTQNISNVVVLTGDIHTAWANDLPGDNYNASTGAGSIGVEFVATSITAGNVIVNFGTQIVQLANPHVKYLNLSDHGYYILDINQQRAQADYFIINDIDNPSQYQYHYETSWLVNDQETFLRQAPGAAVAATGVQALQPDKTPPNVAIGLHDPQHAAATLALLGAYPNPFETEFLVKYYLHKPAQVQFSITDLAGQVLHTTETGKLSPGLHFTDFSQLALPAGFYLLRLQANGSTTTRRIYRR